MKINNRQQTLTIVALAAVGLFAADHLVLEPLTASWKQRQARIAQLRQQVEEGRQLLRREDSLRSSWDRIRTNSFPNNTSQAEEQVLKSFDRWSQESRVSVLSINPQWRRDADEFMTLDCRVEAAGSLSAISRFLYNIEKDPVALRIQALELSSKDNDGQQLALGLQVSGLVLAAPSTTQAKRP